MTGFNGFKRWLLAGIVLVAAALCAIVPQAAVHAQGNAYQVCQTQGAAGSAICRGGGGGQDDDPIAGPNGVIIRATSILAVIAGVVSVIFVLWGGFKYITSNGDSSGVSTAKSTIVAALVGLVIALLARPIVLFVIGKV